MKNTHSASAFSYRKEWLLRSLLILIASYLSIEKGPICLAYISSELPSNHL